ncbi:unnamed protein product [Durusdinium trenchii]|uniref:Uncharacterized protein n=1 Tax=Durusdinium trenchii TaxID=1381693 RepID=A0ABP0NS57_9DINO
MYSMGLVLLIDLHGAKLAQAFHKPQGPRGGLVQALYFPSSNSKDKMSAMSKACSMPAQRRQQHPKSKDIMFAQARTSYERVFVQGLMVDNADLTGYFTAQKVLRCGETALLHMRSPLSLRESMLWRSLSENRGFARLSPT